jgi:glycosyltransferase involved in cell wall biosynthesis
MSEMHYSVVIPTYERPANLAQILDRLHHSVSRKIEVLILIEPDSLSLPPRKQLERWADKLEIKVTINMCKAGVDESILRAYEQCKSEWIYFLGDSKLPAENFELVLNKTHADCPDASAYFFRCDSTYKHSQQIYSIDSLVKSGLTLGDFILGGNSVFSRKIVEKYINYSYRTLSSRIAHVAMPIMALAQGESIYITNRKIIEKFIEKPLSYQPGKALLDCWTSFSLITLLPLTFDDARKFNKYVVDYETSKSRINFYKYIYIKIFREKIQVTKDLRSLLNTRYSHYINYSEYSIVKIIYIIARLVDGYRFFRK